MSFLTFIRLLGAAALVEGMGLSFTSVLGAANRAYGGASKLRVNQVAAAQESAAQSLEIFWAAQGSHEGLAARVARGLPTQRDTSDTLYVTRQPRPLGHVTGAVVDTDYDNIHQYLEHTTNLEELGAQATSEKADALDARLSKRVEAHDGKIWWIPATVACDDCMHALPIFVADQDQHSAQLPLEVDFASEQAPFTVVDVLAGGPEHREEISRSGLATDDSDTAGSGSNSQSSSEHLEVHKLNGKSKLNGFEPSPARSKALRGRTLRRILLSPQSQVDKPEDRKGFSGAESDVLHRELPVEAPEEDQNLFFKSNTHVAPLRKALTEGNTKIAFRIDGLEPVQNGSMVCWLNHSYPTLSCSLLQVSLDGDFWFNLFGLLLGCLLLLIFGGLLMWARVVDRLRYNRNLGSAEVVIPPVLDPGTVTNSFSDQASRGRSQFRITEDQSHQTRSHSAREATSRPRSRSSDSSSSRSSHRSPRSWFYPCAREGCPCPASWDGSYGRYCCLTCRDGTPCAAATHMRPSNWARQPSRSGASRRSRGSPALRATPVVRAEVYSQSEPGQQSVRYVNPPAEGLAAADGRGPWYMCGCPRSCSTMLLCLSGPRPDRCLACTTGSLFPPNGDYGGSCACNCCQGSATQATPVATPGVRVMGRPLMGRLPFMMFMFCCSTLIPLIEGAPAADFNGSVSRLQSFLSGLDDPELQSFVIGLTVSVSLMAARRGLTPTTIFRDVCDFIQGAAVAVRDPSSNEGSTDGEFEPDDPEANPEAQGEPEGDASQESPRYSAFAMGGVLMSGGMAPTLDSVQAQSAAGGCVTAEGDSDSVTSESSAVEMADMEQYLADHPTWGRKGDAVFRQMLMMLLFFTFVTCGNAVTCHTCYDQIEGCVGGDACLLHSRPHANTAVIAGGVGVITLASLLPIKFLRECTRSALDCIKMVANRPQLGTPVDITQAAMTVDQLVEAVQSGAAQPGDAMRECLTRLASAGNQLETNRLNALATLLSHMDKGTTPAGGTGGRSTVLGTYSLAWALAGRIARQTLSVGVAGVSGQSGPSEAATPITQMVKLNITRPSSMAEFSDMITTWLMLCHATGLGHVLVLGEFIRDVVHDTISKLNYSWQLAHELLLVYFEVVETSSDPTINIRNVFAHGSQDTYLKRANDSMRAHFSNAKVKDEPSAPNPANPNKGGSREVKWNGNYDKNATTTCLSYNLGTEHKARSLNEKGTCKHNHVCDHWVSDKGPGGTCGGRHPRSKCDNPNKCDQKVT